MRFLANEVTLEQVSLRVRFPVLITVSPLFCHVSLPPELCDSPDIKLRGCVSGPAFVWLQSKEFSFVPQSVTRLVGLSEGIQKTTKRNMAV